MVFDNAVKRAVRDTKGKKNLSSTFRYIPRNSVIEWRRII